MTIFSELINAINDDKSQSGELTLQEKAKKMVVYLDMLACGIQLNVEAIKENPEKSVYELASLLHEIKGPLFYLIQDEIDKENEAIAELSLSQGFGTEVLKVLKCAINCGKIDNNRHTA